MKPLRLNKVIGLAVGEQSLLAAEVVAGPAAGGRPEVRLLAEFVYPDGVNPAVPAALGEALAAFLRDQRFTARNAVVGLPARWLIVKPKDVPPTDPATLAELLRLQAEGEFSAELKDLVYDYAADATGGQPKSVLLIATPQRYVDGAVALCDAAKLTAVAVTPSAVALGAATAATGGGSTPIVLAVGPAGAELTAQVGAAPSAIRYLRGPAGGTPFLGELRRAVSTLPTAVGSAARHMVLWGTDADAESLGTSLGFPVRGGDLPTLGVDANGSAANGDGRRFAAAVALALSATGDRTAAVDFLHPRLAAPKARRVPRWTLAAALVLVLAVGGSIYAYRDLQKREAILDRLTTQLTDNKETVEGAKAFVEKVSFAQGWHGGNPRYMDCLLELYAAIPQENETYVTSLTLHEPPRPAPGSTAAAAAVKEEGTIIGLLQGKTSTQERAQAVLDHLKAQADFKTVTTNGTQFSSGRDREVTFSITFTYVPPKVAPGTGSPAAAAVAAK